MASGAILGDKLGSAVEAARRIEEPMTSAEWRLVQVLLADLMAELKRLVPSG